MSTKKDTLLYIGAIKITPYSIPEKEYDITALLKFPDIQEFIFNGIDFTDIYTAEEILEKNNKEKIFIDPMNNKISKKIYDSLSLISNVYPNYQYISQIAGPYELIYEFKNGKKITYTQKKYPWSPIILDIVKKATILYIDNYPIRNKDIKQLKNVHTIYYTPYAEKLYKNINKEFPKKKVLLIDETKYAKTIENIFGSNK